MHIDYPLVDGGDAGDTPYIGGTDSILTNSLTGQASEHESIYSEIMDDISKYNISLDHM